MKIGACYSDRGCDFIVWSPLAETIYLKITGPVEKIIPMEKDKCDYWKVRLDGIIPGTKYFYSINNSADRPDPASNFQPQDVHGASEVIDHSSFKWTDKKWKGFPLSDYIIYELHTGTFTVDGTFDAISNKLNYLTDLGITAIEIMPVAQFPGARNWGYDGVYPYAVSAAYGGPQGLKNLVNICHTKGIALILDAVYNHLGPEGNYFGQYGYYFTDKYKTPWGSALNYDAAYSDSVRNFFIENALYWFENFHIDALRLDAIDTIYDMSAYHFLSELSDKVRGLSRRLDRNLYLIAESDLNDPKIITPRKKGGYGIDAQWNDDFHHSVHSLLTRECGGYYEDFGDISDLKESLKNKFVYSGKYSVYRKRKHGADASHCPDDQFVVCIQNHDQVGNRAFGERLSNLVSFEAVKLAAGVMILSPYIPMLFMGEEYAEENPFLFFVSHSDNQLVSAVREGRKKEFESFSWAGDIPNPSDEQTFLKSKLNWELLNDEKHKIIFLYYKSLIKFRRKNLLIGGKSNREVFETNMPDVFALSRSGKKRNYFMLFNFDSEAVTALVPVPEGNWKKIFDSAGEEWKGPGASAPGKIIGKKQNITIKKYSLSIYERK
ncbi:MAG TPA: malto-oligosyltrehalose trehalohydrolase [Ignavibacteriaceae bacterium]|nr:malto-oligosyltrehalose trehalohydrolase [Ignavibacteriaceae bacterium]